MLSDATINGKPAVLAYTIETADGKVSNVMVNLPATIALTELANQGSYENAYRGIDYLTAIYGSYLWETSGWENLRVTHDTHTDWIREHAIFSLT